MKKQKKFQIISIALIGIMYFFVNIQRAAIPGAIFDTLQADFKANAGQITALGAILMYIYAIMQLVLGVLIERFSGKKIIKIGSIFFCLGSILFVFAKNIPFLYFSRFLVAIGVSSYYLSLISELKQSVAQRNYALYLSVILFVGYLGGIFANAPFVVMVNHIGWRLSLLIFAILSIFFSVIYYFVANKANSAKIKSSKKINFNLYKKVLKSHTNLKAIIYACAIYGSFYVLQTVIGKKFLQDFCQFSSIKSATIMSVTATLYALSGILLAFLSKEFYHRKIFFLKVVSSISCLLVLGICTCLILNIKTSFIAVAFCILALGASISSLLVPYLQDVNKKGSSIAISLMIFAMYMMVGFLGNTTGFFLNLFPSKMVHGTVIYSTNSYLSLFVFMFVLMFIAMIAVFRLDESKKIRKLIGIYTPHN